MQKYPHSVLTLQGISILGYNVGSGWYFASLSTNFLLSLSNQAWKSHLCLQ